MHLVLLVAAGLHMLSPVSAAPALASRDTARFSGRLKFERDGTFQISILEDLHFGESRSS